jgi:hypothetical protein
MVRSLTLLVLVAPALAFLPQPIARRYVKACIGEPWTSSRSGCRRELHVDNVPFGKSEQMMLPHSFQSLEIS